MTPSKAATKKASRPPSSRSTVTPLHLADETWGERFHRAYRTGRDTYGLTYRVAADVIAEVWQSIDAASLQRLEDPARTEPPTQQRTLGLAYLALITYGFDPAEFGISWDTCPASIRDKSFEDWWKRIRKATSDLLISTSLCSPISASPAA